MNVHNMQTQLVVIQGNIVNLAENVTLMANYFTEIAKDQMAARSRLSKIEQNMGELTVAVSFLQQKESERLSSQIKRIPTTHTVVCSTLMKSMILIMLLFVTGLKGF